MSTTPSSKARYRHKRALARHAAGKRTQPVGELKLPEKVKPKR